MRPRKPCWTTCVSVGCDMTHALPLRVPGHLPHRQPRGDGLARRQDCAPGALPRIPGFRVERKVGEGRTATAYLACETASGNKVVLKVLRREHAASNQRTAAFVQEFSLPFAIDNPHVIRVYDQVIGGGYASISMEYLPGGDLGRMIRGGVAAEAALSLLRQAALALQALHEHGYAHGDVKPANLLLRSGGELVLADFGQARRLDAVHVAPPAGLVVGTPRYAAPEQSLGGRIGPAGDVYSLGVVLHELLTGRPPFTGPTVMEVFSQHVMAPVPRLPATVAGLQPLLDAMLDKQLATRLHNGRALLERIDFFQGAAPLHPAPTAHSQAGV